MRHKKFGQTILQTKHLLLLSIIVESILFYFYYFPETKIFFGDEQRYLNTGLSIAAGGDWHANPLWPPMQSLVIALFTKIFSDPLLPLQIFQYMLLLLSGFILRDIVWRETHNQQSAQLSLAIMILYPSWLAYSQYLWPEVIHVTLFVSLIWINRYRGSSYKWMVFSGLLLGLAILFKSLLILFIPFLYLPLFTQFGWKKSVVKIFISLIIAMIVITPASIKAHKLTGGLMASNSSMFNLWFGLNDDRRQNFAHDIGGTIYDQYIKSAESFKKRNEIAKEKAINKMQKEGYINTFVKQISKQYFRLFDYQSFFSQQFIGDKNNNFINKYSHKNDEILVRLILFLNNIFYFILVWAMFLGVIVSINQSVIAKQFALFLLYTLALFVLLHTKPRFRIPLVPLMAFNAAYLMCYCNNGTFLRLLKNNKKLFLLGIYTIGIAILVFSAKLLDKYFPI